MSLEKSCYHWNHAALLSLRTIDNSSPSSSGTGNYKLSDPKTVFADAGSHVCILFIYKQACHLNMEALKVP